MPSIFICHSSNDKLFVKKLAETLEAAGIRVWTYEVKIKAGDSMIERIGAGIEEADYFGIVLSNSSLESRWVKYELDVAMHKHIEEGNVVVIPLLLQSVERPRI